MAEGQLRRIVVAMDGSRSALAAAAWGAHLAAPTGAELLLAHVIEVRLINAPFFADIGGVLGAAPYEHLLAGLDVAMEERGKNILGAGEQVCAAKGVRPQTCSERGVFAEVIQELCREASLLILGRRGESAGHGRHLLGSEGERAIRPVDCSCLAVPEAFAEPQRLVVGVNGTGPSRSAVLWAEYLREVFPGLTVRPVHVVENGTGEAIVPDTVAGVPVATEHGRPEDVIVSECSGEEVETLCLIGATGHSRTLKELILGSLSFHVLHKVRGAVLLAR